MKLQEIQARTNDYDETDAFKATKIWSREDTFSVTSSNQTFLLTMTDSARQNILVSCIYRGDGKEMAFTFNASRIAGSVVGVSNVLSQASFGGVTVSLAPSATGTGVEITMDTGTAGSTLTVRSISLL